MIFRLFSKRFAIASDIQTVLREKTYKDGISHKNAKRNLTAAEIYEIQSQRIEPTDPNTARSIITSTGALAAYSGKRTGRSPQDKRIVCDENTRDEVWWEGNIAFSPLSFERNYERAVNYLNTRPNLYVVDGYAGWDPENRLKVRVYSCRSYHSLFMRNMLVMPTAEELKNDFNNVDYEIYNAGEFPATIHNEGVTSNTSVSIDFTRKQMVILGTQYAGEMKKGVFTIMHYHMPKKNNLSMHSSANEGKDGDVSLLFGLSGTGKTALSADPKRRLIGDDEHVWTDKGIFNIEGGCYAKCSGLSREKEPDIWDAVRFGAVLENIKFYEHDNRKVNFNDLSITENTRVSYPLEHINNAKLPAIGGHPKNIFFLTCDAYGVLPPVSMLTHEQAMYHFMSGYTAKIAGTEQDVKEPTATFSACFGEAFLPLHPSVYAELLANKMKKHKTKAWLINTGWIKGKYGIGERIPLKHTRRIIDAIHEGALDNVETSNFEIFNLAVPKAISGIPNDILIPKMGWENKQLYDDTLASLARKFKGNFLRYDNNSSKSIEAAGPKI